MYEIKNMEVIYEYIYKKLSIP